MADDPAPRAIQFFWIGNPEQKAKREKPMSKPLKDSNRFLMGINYWPGETAMYWWNNFDASAVKRDFSLLAEYQFDLVRIFLLWEDFQPEVKDISVKALNHLVRVAELAHGVKIQILPTFFCGHMSGINWLPPWMLESGTSEGGFPLFSMGKIQKGLIRNMYTDREVWKAQKLLIHETTGALQGHPAVWGWDLGNKPSNLLIPPAKDSARAWLEEMVMEMKRWDADLPVTLGMHQEDLEEDRMLGPKEAAHYCDILSMHAYPGYAKWSSGPLDENVPLFLGLLTRWLGGKDVLIEEFGIPTKSFAGSLTEADQEKLGDIFLAEEGQAEVYYKKAFELLRMNGFTGAFAWRFSDYAPALWDKPPFDNYIHERYFGLFRWDGSAKASAKLVPRFPRQKVSPEMAWDWIDIEKDEYYTSPLDHLRHLYKNFKDRFPNLD